MFTKKSENSEIQKFKKQYHFSKQLASYKLFILYEIQHRNADICKKISKFRPFWEFGGLKLFNATNKFDINTIFRPLFKLYALKFFDRVIV